MLKEILDETLDDKKNDMISKFLKYLGMQRAQVSNRVKPNTLINFYIN